ncbi:MAG: Glycine dehydrogenase (Decarboxylating) [Acetothermia bacterium 64_32]|nr:MAG: Glycine dehydrogenase (Decarboxylating) [Acetothermia bacterium 64_32]HAF70980.1 aminomethyl-transferring glycine dehydrogenase subunit GcvPA [Candidatus Acetothermia bacterium]
MGERKKVHPYIPNSVPEVQEEMLRAIGVEDVEELYALVPEELRYSGSLNLPEPCPDEVSLDRHMQEILKKNTSTREVLSFLGGGCWAHYVPAICDVINQRSEFLTAYAGEPYEDHGRFQALFEYASMIAELVEMDVVSVPTYDGSQAAATALRMASRITERDVVLIPRNLNPDRRSIIRNYCHPDIHVVEVKFDLETGALDLGDLGKKLSRKVAAVYFENPSYLGTLETRGAEISRLAHSVGALSVVGVDPISLGILAPPPRYGADVVCGELQPLGVHMYFGGGRGGFVATPDEERFVAEYPLRLFGIAPTVDGAWGFGDVAWERTSFAQRENAKEFVGTMAALWGITAGVYLALLGPHGIQELGELIMYRAAYAAKRLGELPGIRCPRFAAPHFKEFVVDFSKTGHTVDEIFAELKEKKILGGINLSRSFPELGESALVCVTEVHTKEDIDRLVGALKDVLGGA